jgi:SET domain-containing protein
VEKRRTIHGFIGGLVGFEVSVQPEEGKGMGLKAMVPFKRGAIVTQYEGHTITREEADTMGERATHVYSFGRVAIAGYTNRDEAKGFGGGSFANHSDDPNTVFYHDSLSRVYLKAKRDINRGEFISVKYGHQYIHTKKLFAPK